MVTAHPHHPIIGSNEPDLGNAPSAYANNFAFGTIQLSSYTYVQLVDQSANTSGTGAEAVYTNSLIVPSGPRSI